MLIHSISLQVAREEWSGTLWANLNIQVLTDGIEEFLKRLRKFPKEVKALAVCHVLDERMREFKDSIPLFADLKNDALRDRYAVSISTSDFWLMSRVRHIQLLSKVGQILHALCYIV